jgi:uncharacterized integral membrane protein (TIGR00697 family)
MNIHNEILFLLHIITVAGFTLGSLVMGKEALTATICLFSILANLFVTKQITLFGFSVVSTDVFMIGSILGLNMLQEFFGRALAQKTILINFVVTLFYLMMSLIHIWYVPNEFDTMHQHFHIILTPMLRIIIASVLVYLLVQIIDAQLYGFLKNRLHGRFLLIRNLLSLSVTQLIDTILFSFAALYGNVHSVWHIIFVSYTIKLLVIFCSAPFISFAKLIIKSDNQSRS